MKKFLLLAALVLGVQAQATSLHPDTYSRYAKITEWQMTQANPVTPKAIHGGRVLLNKLTKKIRIDLQIAPLCPEGTYCPMVLIYKTIANAAIVSESTDACGVITYTAVHDELSIDANKDTITLQDTTQAHCDEAYAAPVMVEHVLQYWNRMGGFMVEHRSEFKADAFDYAW